jgi:hypothetical protein
LQRGAVVGQFESSRHATHLPLAQYGVVPEHAEASTHSTHAPRLQMGSLGSLQSVALRHSTHSPDAVLQNGSVPPQLESEKQPLWHLRSGVQLGADEGQSLLVTHWTHSPLL